MPLSIKQHSSPNSSSSVLHQQPFKIEGTLDLFRRPILKKFDLTPLSQSVNPITRNPKFASMLDILEEWNCKVESDS